MMRGVNGDSRTGSNAVDTINAAASAIAAAERRVPQATEQVNFLKDLTFLVIIDSNHVNFCGRFVFCKYLFFEFDLFFLFSE